MLKALLSFAAVIAALITHYFSNAALLSCAEFAGTVFINLLKLVSLPIIFLSITSTFSSFSAVTDLRNLLGKTLFYTLLTTGIAAVVALFIYLIISPSDSVVISGASDAPVGSDLRYGTYLLSVFPDNFVKIFLENNVMGCIVVAFLLGIGSSFIDNDKREVLHKFLDAAFEALLRAASFIVKLMPLAIWAFVTTFLNTPMGDFSYGLGKYLICVILANLIQAVVVLPLLIKMNKIPVVATLKKVTPALFTAFFSRSSSAALPITIECVQKIGIDKKIASFVLPLCTTINMNACASFILITVLFVCEVNAHVFSMGEIIAWVILSIIAAVGNAGVPMGCYFMAMNYLISMKMPLNVMGIILPIYALIDMFETALNVWSDICITGVISKKSVVISKKYIRKKIP